MYMAVTTALYPPPIAGARLFTGVSRNGMIRTLLSLLTGIHTARSHMFGQSYRYESYDTYICVTVDRVHLETLGMNVGMKKRIVAALPKWSPTVVLPWPVPA